jgi:hypothetical protein
VLEPGAYHDFEWRIGDTGGAPIAQIGVEISSMDRADGSMYLDYLTWDGPPDVVFMPPAWGGNMWRRAWVDGADQFSSGESAPFRLNQNDGTGLLMQGTREWTDYGVSATITPHLVASGGIAVRVQGMRRYYALLLCTGGVARLVKALDGETVLAEAEFGWELGESYTLSLQVVGQHLEANIDGQLLLSVDDEDQPLRGGGVALVCTEGFITSDAVTVRPVG